MGQPIPDIPLDLLLISDSDRAERQGNKSHKRVLHPPPLFRSIGLTGLSASLPPHRRLRSVLHRAVQPTNANETANSWLQVPCSSSIAKTERGMSLKGYINSHEDDSNTYSDSFPIIKTQTHVKPGLPQPPPDKGVIRAYRKSQAGETKTHSFPSSSSSAQAGQPEHVPTRSNVSFSHKMLIPHRTVHQSINIGLSTPSKSHHRRRTVSSLPVSEVRSSETEETKEQPMRKRRGRSRKIKIINTGEYSQSQPSEKDQDDAFCQWLSSLGISDRDQDATDCQKRLNRLDRGLEGAEKGACSSRRDRRPHFLPPISQSDCLLNVPLVLPENSPPPSPSRVTIATFFPLQVPAFPLWTEHRLKHT
ncbi:hypothetical protein AMEX_G4784 [Astyanax mexicanus]|uniref:Uncharacterized protein n=1 Tax=Astyanax mexicanus TaxID=7994 RepID=A0A8T2M5D5_ASTMX|nr:hypothetical protein AMEX_G4784 [Astyanax mexicanus]